MPKTIKKAPGTVVPPTPLISFPPLIPLPGHDAVELTTDGSIITLGLPNRFQDTLDNLFAEWDALDQQIKALTAEKKEKAEELGRMLDSRKLKAISCADLSVRWVYSHSSNINKLALLKNGVSADVIVASTKQSPHRSLKVVNPARKAEAVEEGSEE